MNAGFSLLLPVYSGDDPRFLRRALDSSTREQTLPPDEVVLVQDGPVDDALACVLEEAAQDPEHPARLVRLERNVGLARALEAGLAACSHDVVARMDADDVSLPTRFEKTVPLVLSRHADLVGTGLLEFLDDEKRTVGVRLPPTRPDTIARVARLHDPFNHPTVVYRRSAVRQAGGYQHLPMMEDYWLFARMIAAGVRVANVREPLVLYRIGAGAYRRRGGAALLRAELAVQLRFVRSGFTTPGQFVRNTVVRGTYRLVPYWIRIPLYKLLVARRGERLERTIAT